MLAMIELRRNQPAYAMAIFKKALRLNPGDVAVRMNLGVMHLKYRQMGQASVHFERVLKVVPGHQDALMHMAVIKALRGDTAGARDTLKDILSSKKDNSLALFNLAVVERQAGEYDDALGYLKRYIQSARGRAAQAEEVFALIDSIQKQRSAKGDEVSDDEIQALAAGMAKSERSASSDGKRTNPKTQASKAPVAPAPTNAPAESEISGSDEIDELEKDLQ
jgi:Flp pilus assembly protein TadD